MHIRRSLLAALPLLATSAFGCTPTVGPGERCGSDARCSDGYSCGSDGICCGCPSATMMCIECPGSGPFDSSFPPLDTGVPDAASDATLDVAPDGSGMVLVEMEPNDGTTTDEVNDLPVGTTMRGAIDASGDSDIFLVPTRGGRAYLISLTTPGALMGHVTVIDSGRGTDAAGGDYVHLSRTGVGADVELDLLAMGDGHLVAVRDVRSLDGGAGSGGADHDYTLRVTEVDLATIATPLTFPSTATGALAHPGAMRVHGFDGSEGTWVTLDLAPAGDMDARLFVVAESTGSWIARNDDRGPADDSPLIDAPLTASGPMFLVVENIDEGATGLGYSVDASSM